VPTVAAPAPDRDAAEPFSSDGSETVSESTSATDAAEQAAGATIAASPETQAEPTDSCLSDGDRPTRSPTSASDHGPGGKFAPGNTAAIKHGLFRSQPAELAPLPLDWRERGARFLFAQAERYETTLASMPTTRRSLTFARDAIGVVRELRQLAEELRLPGTDATGRAAGECGWGPKNCPWASTPEFEANLLVKEALRRLYPNLITRAPDTIFAALRDDADLRCDVLGRLRRDDLIDDARTIGARHRATQAALAAAERKRTGEDDLEDLDIDISDLQDGEDDE
jgi:hypothetical protein